MTKKTNTKEIFESFSLEKGLEKLTINERKFINNYMKDNRTQNERQGNYQDQTNTKGIALIEGNNKCGLCLSKGPGFWFLDKKSLMSL